MCRNLEGQIRDEVYMMMDESSQKIYEATSAQEKITEHVIERMREVQNELNKVDHHV
jgi:hypothetical protein